MSDKEIIQLLKQDRDAAFDFLFRQHYTMLCRMAFRQVQDEAQAKDLVQEVFTELWERNTALNIHSSFEFYLKKAVIYKIQKHHHRQLKWRVLPENEISQLPAEPLENPLQTEELRQLIKRTIDGLPSRCRLVFMLSRFENMTYREIADHLEISPKTVDNQISKALKILKKALYGQWQNLLLPLLLIAQ